MTGQRNEGLNHRLLTTSNIIALIKTGFKKKEMQHLVEIAKLHDAKINVIHIDRDKEHPLNSKLSIK